MIHLQDLTKYRESKIYKQSYVFMLLQFFSFFSYASILSYEFTNGHFGQFCQTENINLSPIYINFHVKRLVWSERKVI